MKALPFTISNIFWIRSSSSIALFSMKTSVLIINDSKLPVPSNFGQLLGSTLVIRFDDVDGARPGMDAKSKLGMKAGARLVGSAVGTLFCNWIVWGSKF